MSPAQKSGMIIVPVVPDPMSAMTNGFQSAFATAIVFSAVGLVAAAALLGKLRLPVPEPVAIVEAD